MTRADFIHRGGLWVLAQAPLMLIAVVLPVWLGRGQLLPQHPLSVFGAALTVVGFILTVWGLKSLGDALTPFPEPLSGATLNRQGAYRWMRHPVYAGVMLGSLGWALWWLSAAGVIYAIALAAFFDRKAAFEERRLRARFPDYADYAARVRKFVPGIY